MKQPVSIVPCPSYEQEVVREALKQVLQPLGGLSFVRPGMKVVIKTNLVAGSKPENAVTTHPMLLAELTRMLTDAGASVVIGDSPGGPYLAPHINRIYKVSGLALAEEAGAVLNQDFSQKSCHDPFAVILKEFHYTSYVDEADVMINFCKLKTHGMMGMSAAAKNLFGLIPGTMKPEYHYRFPKPEDFANMLVDIQEHFKPVLNIVDAVVGMEGNGPTAGTPRPIGCLLASASPYGLDMICSKIIGLPWEQIPTLKAAHKRGLVENSPEEVTVIGDVTPFLIKDYLLVEERKGLDFSGSGPFGKVIAWAGSTFLQSKPVLISSLCVGCGECFRVCPAKAIVMKDKKPVIHRNECIKCFCCQEFCPKSAMKVRRTAVARFLNR